MIFSSKGCLTSRCATVLGSSSASKSISIVVQIIFYTVGLPYFRLSTISLHVSRHRQHFLCHMVLIPTQNVPVTSKSFPSIEDTKHSLLFCLSLKYHVFPDSLNKHILLLTFHNTTTTIQQSYNNHTTVIQQPYNSHTTNKSPLSQRSFFFFFL